MNAKDLNRLVIRWAEPVRQSRIELSDFARTHRDVVFTDDQPYLTGKHVQPFVALVGAKPTVALGRNDDFPHMQAARLEDVPDGYRAMNDREVLKFQIKP